ncbi:hypothetical protein ACFX13_036983 [Malus domestica]
MCYSLSSLSHATQGRRATFYHSPEQYRSVVGALQYLTFTRPDIAFDVNQCCQFMHSPMDSHVVAMKRILRYLNGIMEFGIHLKPGKLSLQAYSNADWAGNPNDRRSTSGYIVYLGTSLISWASRKQLAHYFSIFD